jgi:hypothetical protein
LTDKWSLKRARHFGWAFTFLETFSAISALLEPATFAREEETVSLSYKQVQEHLRKAGIVISKRGGMHRINIFGGQEDTARYTSSLQEALEMGLVMGTSGGRRS